MNQTLLEVEAKSHVPDTPQPPEPPPAPVHPRFAKPQRIAFVQACWHREVVQEARIAFLAEIEARHVPRSAVDLFEVPGSFEIPLHAQLLAKTRRYTAIVAAGLVVDGGIYRHEFVADTVIKALMDVQLRTEVPVFSAVLTPQQFHESQAHFDFFRKHFATKGIEVAEACAYLSAASGKYITGETLTVDGGGQLWGETWTTGKPEYFGGDEG